MADSNENKFILITANEIGNCKSFGVRIRDIVIVEDGSIAIKDLQRIYIKETAKEVVSSINNTLTPTKRIGKRYEK